MMKYGRSELLLVFLEFLVVSEVFWTILRGRVSLLGINVPRSARSRRYCEIGLIDLVY